MSKKARNLTTENLLKIVLEEKEKYEKDVKAAAAKTREIDADEYADTLEKEVNHLAVLKIKEVQAKNELKKIQQERQVIRGRIQKLRS